MSDAKEAQAPLGFAVLASIVGHSLLVLAAVVAMRRGHAVAAPVDEALAEDRWAGTTLDVAYVEEVAGGAAAPEPSLPSSPSQATSLPTETAPPPAEHATEPAPKADDAPKTATQDVPRLEKKAPKKPHAESPPAETPASSRSRAKASPIPAASGGPTSAGATGTFGMDTVATSHQLGRAFTAAIARTNQADESWSKRAVGDAGSLVFDVTIDDEGRAAMARPADPEHAPAHLVEMVKRTMFSLRSGVFAVRGDVVAGVERLRITVSVSDVQEEEIAGGHAAVGQRFENGHGRSSFTMSNGRHVEIRIDVLSAAAPKR